MIERHGPELRRAHVLLRPFYYADKTDIPAALQSSAEMLRQKRFTRAVKYLGGAALCAAAGESAYERSKRFASRLTRRHIIAIGGESVVALQTVPPQEEAVEVTTPKVRKYATRINPREVGPVSDELKRRYGIAKSVMGERLVATQFGIGLDARTDQPATLIMDQPYVPEPAYSGHCPATNEAIEEVRESAEKLLVDHGLIADLYDANGNIRKVDQSSAALVDVSFASVRDSHQLLVPALPTQNQLHIQRILSPVPNVADVRYNEAQ